MKRLLIGMLLTAAFAVPAFAQMKDKPMKQCKECDMQEHHMGEMNHMDMGHMDMMGGGMMGQCIKNADKIGLSEEQKKKVTPLHQEMQKKQIRFQADLKIAQLEMKEIMEPKDFDIEKAKAAMKKTEDIKTAHHLEMLKAMKEVRSVFTDEQYKKMKELMPMNMGANKTAKGKKHKH
jgi:Spy/CpxP family protein refolding chaperone